MKKDRIRLFGAGILVLLWLLLSLAAWFFPRTDISETERRKLQQFPALSIETLTNGRFMTKFETFTQDQFPFRETFRQLKAAFGYGLLRRGENNGIYLADGYAAQLEYPLDEGSVAGAVEKFQRIYDMYLKDKAEKIVFCVAPDKNYYLASANGYPAMDYDALFDAMEAIEWAEYVDITDSLDIRSYYRTDTHWRQESLLPAAEKIASALGAEVKDDYRAEALERPFYGVYYGQAALPMAPDSLYILESDTLAGCTVTNHETGKQLAVYDMEKLDSRDLYDVFLSGPVSALTVENPAAQDDRELIVFRDSFGSSLVPLLVPGYARVTLLDIRYVPTALLGNYAEFEGRDVLFLYSPLVLNNSAMLR